MNAATILERIQTGEAIPGMSNDTRVSLTHALAYEELGWSVIPIRDDGSKIPHVSWKEFQQTRPDREQIVRWWQKWPTAGVGMVTGEISGVVVLDFDSQSALDEFEARFNEIPQSITQSTGRAGGAMHVFLKHPGSTVKQGHSRIITDLDVKGDGSIVLLPPTLHKSGRRYAWGDINPLDFGLDDLLDIPGDVLEVIQASAKTASSRKESSDDRWLADLWLFGVKEGERNDTVTKVTGKYMHLFRGDYEQVRAMMDNFNKSCCSPPMDVAELEKTVRSIKARYDEAIEVEREAVESINLASSSRPKMPTNLLGYELVSALHLKYMDGTNKIRMKLMVPNAESDDPPLVEETIDVSFDEFLSLGKMTVRLASVIRETIVAKGVTKKIWNQITGAILPNTEVVRVGIEESDLAPIYEVIAADVMDKETAPRSLDMLSNSSAVLIDETIINTCIKSVTRAIEISGRPAPNERQLGDYLTRMGFVKQTNRPRIDGHRITLWTIRWSIFNAL